MPQPADLVVGLGGSVGRPGLSRASLEAMGPEDALLQECWGKISTHFPSVPNQDVVWVSEFLLHQGFSCL